MNNFIFGHTRFSVFHAGSPAWRASKFLSEKEYKDWLFDEERLDIRMRMFEKITLPSIKSNIISNKDYFHLVEVSEGLPKKYIDFLLDIQSSYEQIKVVRGNIKTAVERVVADFGEGNGMVALFKLDDDDAISKDYVSRLKKYMISDHDGYIVSFPKGYTGMFDDKSQKLISLKDVYQSKINIGLSQLFKFQVGAAGSVEVSWFSRGSHSTCDERYPVILDASKPSYFWLRSSASDTSVQRSGFDSVLKKSLDKLSDSDVGEFGYDFDFILSDGLVDL